MLRDIFNNNDEPFYLIAVDAGVSKKIDKLSSYLYKAGWTKFNIIQCIKKRDMTTGQIYGFEVFANDLQKLPCILVDDICDGGASFYHAAKEIELYNPGKMYAFFSHGIFSSFSGLLNLKEHYTRIYTTNSIKDSVDDNFFTQFQFKI
jgi:ribose-phosphate pyrophosphokinase